MLNVERLKERFLVNDARDRVGVVVGLKAYRRLRDELEEPESIRVFGAAKAAGDGAIPMASS